MVHHSHCLLCGSEKIGSSFTCTDHFFTKESFPVFECSDCGFLFTQDYPDESEISSYYESEEYISHSDTSSGITNRVYHVIRSLMLRRKRALISRVTGLGSGSILDVGCGTGHFAAAMKKGGWTAAGIEINERARKFAAETFGLEIISPENISILSEGSIDCITLWHVLEHFYDPRKYLEDLKPLLRNGGTFVVALPNRKSFDAEHFGAYWAAWDVPRHLWHFDPATFRDFSLQAGLRLVRMLTLPFDVFYISLLSEKYRDVRLYFISGMIKGLWFALKTVFSREKCSSVIYILKPVTDQ
jgi:SAM-dependent methyltransferase